MKSTRKGSVTQAEVNAAMEVLRLEGAPASVRGVRERIGRGSLTTISRLMGAVNAGNHTPALLKAQFPSRLEGLCRELVDALDELAEQQVAAEREQVEVIRRNIESRWNGLEMEKEAAVQELKAEKRFNIDLRERVQDLETKLAAALKDAGELNTRVVTAEAENKQLGLRLSEASEKIAKHESYITTYETQVREQRRRDSDEHANKIAGMEFKLAASQEREVSLTSEMGESQRKLDTSQNNLRDAERRVAEAVNKRVELEGLVAQLSVEQVETQKRESRREQLLIEALAVREAAQRQVSTLQEQVIKAQARTEKVRAEVTTESRSVISNLVGHSRRVFELAKASAIKSNPELSELAVSQREIERMFGGHEGTVEGGSAT